MCSSVVNQPSLPFTQVVSDGAPWSLPPPAGETQIEFVRMPRARRYILRVRPDGTLRVTVPRGGSRREAEEFVGRQRRWIERERIRVRQEHAPRRWHEGSVILLRGAPVRLSVQPRGEGWVVRYGEREIHAPLAGDVRAAVERDLRALARIEVVARLHELAARHDLRPQAVTIRNQRSRWGSCGRTGTIALNFRLVQMPPDVRDYVLVHELMHMRHQNHSRRFWKLVAAACPGYRDAERWLRVEGKALF
jgi:predicted metal-dependent hydrolase